MKTYNLSKYWLPIVFLKDIYERKLTLEETDNEQSKLANELKGIDRNVKLVEKNFLNNIEIFLSVWENVFNDFYQIQKSEYF